MRVFWIVLGIVALVWLGYLQFDRNQVRLDLDRTNQRIDGVEQQVDNGNVNDDANNDLNVGQELQDEMQDAGEEIRQGIPTKEEQAKDEMQDEAEEMKEEQMEKEETPADKEKEAEDQKKKVDDATSFIEQEAVVAFDFDYANTDSEATHAFKLNDGYAYQTIDVEKSKAYFIVDPILLGITE
jgi:hypothetical protein